MRVINTSLGRETEAVRWTGKNTGEVKAWIHTQLLADPAAMATHGRIAPFVKRRGSHMTEVLWGNVLPGSAPTASAALWLASHGQYVGLVDGEWIVKDDFGFYPCTDSGDETNPAPVGYLPIPEETKR